MFRIGEFSRIARVSGRLLRYYDEIGLLCPKHTDAVTGYRYYTADQLGRLNRILALKDLGLSLDRVSRMLDDRISTEEIRGMLMLKKAELEQSLSEEATRLRHIESRLQQIDEQGSLHDYDVVVKAAEQAPYLAVRRRYPRLDDAMFALGQVARAASRIPAIVRDALVVVAYSDFEDENLDLEIGYRLRHEAVKAITVASGLRLGLTQLPAVEKLATLVRKGPKYQSHLAFGALGVWMDANGFSIAGPSREVFLDLSLEDGARDRTVMEVQFPVARAS